MSKSATVLRKTTVDGVEYQTEETVTCGMISVVSELIPNGGATINVPIDVSALKLLQIQYPEAVTLTTDAPETLDIGADVAFLWTESDPAANKPFASDVATIQVPNTSGGDQLIEIVIGVDVTP